MSFIPPFPDEPLDKDFPDPLASDQAKSNPYYRVYTSDIFAYFDMLQGLLSSKQADYLFDYKQLYEHISKIQRKQHYLKHYRTDLPIDSSSLSLFTQWLENLDDELTHTLQGDAAAYFRELKYFMKLKRDWETEYFLKHLKHLSPQ